MTQDFKEWIRQQHWYPQLSNPYSFTDLPFSFRWGVYLDFFKSKELEIWLEYTNPEHGGYWDYLIFENGDYTGSHTEKDVYIKTREEAQKEAVKKAFEILKERNDGKVH